MDKIGLSLAGGGVKGSYQIGVWQALLELDIHVSAITGTSIGSINGALFVQSDIETVLNLWTNISIDQVINISMSDTDNLFNLKNIIPIVSDAYKNNGLDVSPLSTLLDEIIDEDRIRNSSIDFGLATHSLTERKEVQMFIKDIPFGSLSKYIMASSCFPGAKIQTINEEKFIDGGVCNNIPMDMLIKKGYRDIIAVDVGGVGVIKNVDTTGLNIFTIKCCENILGIMDFNIQNIKRSIKLGYFDCYKTFGRLLGDKYYFNSSDYCLSKRKYSEQLLYGLECAASIFKIDNVAVYRVEDLIKGVLKGYKKANVKYEKKKSEFRNDNIFEMIRKGTIKFKEEIIVAWIVDLIYNQHKEYMQNKLLTNILGDSFYAANAIIYFLVR